jgi:ABC-type histidine transport system ATPase subunit
MGPRDATHEVAGELERLANRANRLRVPLGFAQQLFILKSHITLVQQEVEKRRRLAGNEQHAGQAGSYSSGTP